VGVVGVLGLALVTAYARWGCLHTLDDATLAKRLLESRGVICTPKIVERVDEGVLRVVCADGKFAFARAMSCSESFACEFLGFDAACWESVPLGALPSHPVHTTSSAQSGQSQFSLNGSHSPSELHPHAGSSTQSMQSMQSSFSSQTPSMLQP
jgi:hypothetical protein